MKENKKVMPSGISSPYCAATLTKFKRRFAFLSLLFCVLMLSSNVCASSLVGKQTWYTWLRTSSDQTTGSGLVYARKADVTPSPSDYGLVVLSADHCTTNEGKGTGEGGQWIDFYAWAKPARGYVFKDWTGYEYTGSGKKDSEAAARKKSGETYDGDKDILQALSWGGGRGNDAAGSAKATWQAATRYTVTYKEPTGGSYAVEYKYDTVKNSSFTTVKETLNLSPGSGDKRPFGVGNGSQEGYSYAADTVTFSTAAGNFVGWYEDGEWLSSDNPCVYSITKSATITALFKWIEPVAPEGKLIRTSNNNLDVPETLVFSMENIVSVWETADFSVSLVGATGSGLFTLGEYEYNAETEKLTVNFTYNANGHYDEGSTVTIQVAPAEASYGTSASVQVSALAEEESEFQARVSGDDFATQEGDLTDMLDIANDHTDATLTLLQPVAITSPLVVSKSMTLDLNNKLLSASAIDKIISVEGTDVKLTITDNSFLKGGDIRLTRNANAAIAAIEVTGTNRLVYNRGKITVTNEATGANAKAYGIYESGAGNVVLQGGSIKVESDHDARGLFIASGNATLNAGAIEATAKNQAYALYSGGKINIAEDVSLTASTTTGSDASAIYLNAGTAVLDNVTITATSAANNAYGANVQGGKLSFNGGNIISTATASYAYGVYIAAGANATLQQQANITATAATARAYGIQNLGTLQLTNSSITATAATYPTAVNSESSAVSTTIEGGNYTANATSDHAYGLLHQHGALSVDGGTFTATSVGDAATSASATVYGTIANATLNAETTETGTTALGFECGETGTPAVNFELTNCTIKAKSATSKAYAIYSRGNVTATNCALDAKTNGGADAQGMYIEKGDNTLNNTNATVESYTKGAYGVKLDAGSLTLDGGTYNITAKQSTSVNEASTI